MPVTSEDAVDIVFDDGGRWKESCDRSFGSPSPSDYEHAHTYCSPRLDTYATKVLPPCLVWFLGAATPRLCTPNDSRSSI